MSLTVDVGGGHVDEVHLFAMLLGTLMGEFKQCHGSIDIGLQRNAEGLIEYHRGGTVEDRVHFGHDPLTILR